ncbi:MAG: Flp family type IVb pilin [Rickettsiales bacterium]
MSYIKSILFRLAKDNAGTVAIEYGLIVTIISVIAIGSMISVGGSVDGFFTSALAGLR